MNHDVFISYENNDKSFADELCEELESNGIKCWIAPRNVVGNYPKAIIRAIKSSRVMLLVLSSKTNSSDMVAKEVERAASNRIPLCTIRKENVQPSEELELFVSSHQWIDAWGITIQEYIPELIKQISIHIPPAPKTGEKVTPRHIALAYNCWRKEYDKRFSKWDEKHNKRIYRLDLSVETSWEVIQKIDYVEYFLHPSWKSAGSLSEYKIEDRDSNFKLKELIWGNFLLYAQVYFKDQEYVPLSCYVQLPKFY